MSVGAAPHFNYRRDTLLGGWRRRLNESSRQLVSSPSSTECEWLSDGLAVDVGGDVAMELVVVELAGERKEPALAGRVAGGRHVGEGHGHGFTLGRNGFHRDLGGHWAE